MECFASLWYMDNVKLIFCDNSYLQDLQIAPKTTRTRYQLHFGIAIRRPKKIQKREYL